MLGREPGNSFLHRRKALAAAVLACAGALPVFAVPVRAEHARAPISASPLAETISVVRFIRDGTAATVETTARNVAGFLAEQGITLAPEDYVSLDPTAPIVDGATLEYRAAIPVTLVVGNDKETFRTSAVNVAALLSSKDIALGPLDRITPPLSAALEPDSVVRIQRVRVWTESIRKPIPAKTVRRLDPALAPNQQRVLREGIPGIRETTFRVTEIDGVTRRSVIRERTLRKPQPRIVGTGFGLYGRLGALALRAAEITSKMTKTALRMIATGYSAACPGCSGYTALGARAGYGIVAVDPAVIPLGTRLFIPGYGRAIAGDTGGSIHGNRIDLGFDSNAEAMRFGRRLVQVYVLPH